ncbi:DUF2505 domain-containing protein [Angustibacter sp. McL0619]|uniref:DUF2505 domain-containing protein n=1 Tax=Angustibacter sp. McL0619 TaxID=3415676 RepID=UPI003CF859F5
MKFTADIRYEAAPADVFAMLTTSDFQRQVCDATGAIDSSVDVEEAGGGATITTTRTLPADDLPDFVRRFVGSTLQVMRVDHWGAADATGARSGTVVVEIKGAPVRLTGTLALAADGSGTAERVDGDLKASIPLVGGKVEKAAEPAIRSAIAKEQEIGNEWLG